MHMNSPRRFLRKISLVMMACCLAHGPAGANPENPLVTHGRADIVGRGNVLTITNTPGTVINWQNFNIRPGEITRFIQQGSDSAVLNRIVGQDPSQIFGALESNGRVFLINPNGILFGAGARVDVNGFVASTLQLSNEDFLAGRNNFIAGAGTPGAIRNQGAITTPRGGSIYLIAPNIENSGLITSPQGEIVLAAGHEVRLADSMDPSMHVVVSAPQDQAINLGRVMAESGRIGIFGALVNQRGIVNADSAVAGENGTIVLRSSTQTLLEAGSVTSARGAGTGGEIHILGDHVGLTGDAKVDASGETGGGTVLIGGDFQGRNGAITNASATYVGAEADVRADAITSGNGGRIIVWADEATRMFGHLSARGGALSGDGGFAEVSGKKYLEFAGRADLRAPHGASGSLLLDPNDITIQDGPAPPTDVIQEGPPTLFSGGPASSVLTVADLVAALQMGNVTVNTSGGTGGPLGGRITVANAVSWMGGALTLSADNGIAINGTMTNLGDGTLLLDTRGGTITQTAPINVTYLGITALGDVNLGSVANNVSVLGAHIGDGSHLDGNLSFLNSTDLMVSSVRGINGITIDLSGGSSGGIATLRTAGNLTQGFSSFISARGLVAQGNSVTLNGSNPTTAIAGEATGSFQTFSYTGANGITVSNIGGFAGIQTANGQVDLVAETGDIAMPAGVNSGAAFISMNALAGSVSGGTVSGGGLTVNAANGINLTTQLANLQASNSTSGDITVSNTGALQLQSITQSGGGAIGIVNNGTMTLGTGLAVTTTTGAISLASRGALTVSGSVGSNGGGAITLEATPTGSPLDQLNINGAIDTVAGAGTAVSTTGPILLRAGDAINIAGTVAGAVTQQALLNGPPLPTISDCIANPALPRCNEVLPSLASCIASPALPGCSVVLPTLSSCIASPALPGCEVVLPSMASCTAAPTLPGCEVVLPTLAACTATPSLPGCSAVLPTLGACTATPSLPGCSAVLPTIATCTTTPSLPGCSVVLPSLAACTTTPSLPGCSVVLPSVAVCTTAPSTPGCSAVLPSLAACTTTPSLPGCSAVLPTLGACTATPSLPGCSAVLPTIAACTTTPSLPGCSVVLPSLAACTTTPSLPGCSVVLPSAAVCSTAPSTPGCSAVLPTLATCTSTPTLPGCSAVLPGLSACIANPSLPGCSAVLPSLVTCVSTPSLPGCAVVLPSLASCIASPTLPGCSTVLPTTAQCAAAPTLPGCTASLPTLSQCVVNPTLTGCSAVLPSLASCTAAPATAGCNAVLPSIATCTSAPTTAGCSTVLPSVAICTVAPTTAGCSAVLPSLATCTAAPATAGCNAVLPSIAICTTTPTIAGCSAVLPSLPACTTAPTTAGCSAVLPSLAACTTTPTLLGCSVVLPTLTTCVVLPSVAGCSAVLPSLASCVANPSVPGCLAVLPSLSTCSSAPTTAGCSAVLPSLAQCVASPSLQGCAAVLPPVSICVTNPSAPGCTVVLPPISNAAPDSPTAQALNTIVSTITTPVGMSQPGTSNNPVTTNTGTSTGTGSATGGTGASASPTGDTKVDDDKSEKKAEEKNDDKKDVVAAEKSGAKNEPSPPKTFCN
jgi:filamentous hemagglutinin family protein